MVIDIKNNGQQFNVTVARFIFQCVNVKNISVRA